jgi:hypothetical protein
MIANRVDFGKEGDSLGVGLRKNGIWGLTKEGFRD